jgi:hypothetical protein
MNVFLLSALATAIVCLLIFLVCQRIAGVRSFSAPFGVLFFGFFGGVLSLYLGVWAAVAVSALYLAGSLAELRNDLGAQKDGRS